LLGGAYEVLDVVEVDLCQVGTPGRQRLALEQPQPLEAKVEHPLWLVLLRRDVANDLFVEATPRVGARNVGVGPAVLVPAQDGERLLLRQGRLLLGHQCTLSLGRGWFGSVGAAGIGSGRSWAARLTGA